MNAALLNLIEGTLNKRPAIIQPHPRYASMVRVKCVHQDGHVEEASFTAAAVRAAAKNGWNFVTKERR